MMTLAQGLLGAASGSLVGFSLGLVGGGGSILAVPLMVYLVGVPSAHVAIGTSSLAVAASAAFNLMIHARTGMVKWGCAAVLAAAGVVGAALGSVVGKMVDGQRLLMMFALLMLVVVSDASSPRSRRQQVGTTQQGQPPVLAALGLVTGILSGFFGIGGGFTDCACAGVRDRHAAGLCGEFVAGGCAGFRLDHGDQLRGLWACELAVNGGLYCRRTFRRLSRCEIGAPARGPAGAAQRYFRGGHFLCCHLHAGPQRHVITPPV